MPLPVAARTRAAAPWLGLLLAIGAAACAGDAPTGGGSGRLVLDIADAPFTRVTDSLRVTGKVGAQAVTSFALRTVSESRGVAALPVLEPGALRRGVLLPGGPGTALVEATTMGLRDTVAVTVTVSGPTVFAVRTSDRGGADTTTFLGVALDQLPANAITIAGTAVPYFSQGATAIQVAAPAPATTCAPGAASVAFAVTGSAVSPAATLYRPGGAPVDLAVDEWRELTPREVSCLRLAGGDREYVVAHVDHATVDSARTRFYQPPATSFSTTVADRTAGGAPGLVTVSAVPAVSVSWERHDGPVPEQHESDGLPGTCSDVDFTPTFRGPWCRSKPWAVGDTMRIVRPFSLGADTVRASVYAIYGGRWVFARIDKDTSAALRRMQDTIAAVMPTVVATSIPLLREAYGVADPTTSRAAGQLLTVIGDFTHGAVGGGCCVNDGWWTTISLGSTLASDRGRMFHLITHEYTHAYQRQFMFDSLPPGGDRILSGGSWGTEGGADLIAFEAVRRHANLPWAGNLDDRPLSGLHDLGGPMLDEFRAAGRLALGYHHASAFLRDVVFRLEARGVARSTALYHVARGASEGWFGWDPAGVKRPGIADRVQALTGTAFDPSLAVLRYALSQGADERVASEELRNPFWLTIWRSFGGDHRDKQVTAGSASAYVAGDQPRMSTGVIRLAVPGPAGAFALSGSVGGLRWAIARTR